jgi:hypothetical protein
MEEPGEYVVVNRGRKLPECTPEPAIDAKKPDQVAESTPKVNPKLNMELRTEWR